MNVNNSPKVSILVPIFNVEKYLDTCLKSIQDQTFVDIEIICINDGSTDGSLNIIERFIEIDSRFKLINKNNTGYGHSMNLGISSCSGKYIGIVESDDFIECTMIEKLYNISEQYHLDIARCNYNKFSNFNNKKEDLSFIPEGKVVKPTEEILIFYQAPAIWANLYRRDFLNKNNIRFLETPGASYQDTSFAFKVYSKCKRFMFIDEALLNYRTDNENSSINNPSKIFCVCDEYKEILFFCKKNPDIYNALKLHIPVLRFSCYAWNLSRIGIKFRFSFLKAWKNEIDNDFDEKRINKNIIGIKKLKKMKIIRYFPWFYILRKKGL